MSFLKVDLASLHSMLDEMGDAAEGAARPAAQAAIQVLYDDVVANVARLGKRTGNLAASIYQVYSQNNSGTGFATYHVSWNQKKAPHGGLVEFGHIQRYAAYIGSNGKWYTAVRPGMKGKPRPKRRASQAEKDAYYVPLAAPKQIAAKSFVRKAETKFPQALIAAEQYLLKAINGT
jgi:hypothetical protein